MCPLNKVTQSRVWWKIWPKIHRTVPTLPIGDRTAQIVRLQSSQRLKGAIYADLASFYQTPSRPFGRPKPALPHSLKSNDPASKNQSHLLLLFSIVLCRSIFSSFHLSKERGREFDRERDERWEALRGFRGIGLRSSRIFGSGQLRMAVSVRGSSPSPRLDLLQPPPCQCSLPNRALPVSAS